MVAENHMSSGLPVDNVFNEVMLLYNQIRVFEADFYDHYGFKIHFNEEATNEIIRKAMDEDKSAVIVCQEISRDYDYGFKLIADRSGQIQFILPRRAVSTPDLYLEELIRESYRRYPTDAAE